jgi:aminopeptidase-like protein
MSCSALSQLQVRDNLVNGPVDLNTETRIEHLGGQMHKLMAELFPICRSITGKGFRDSLAILSRHIPLQPCEVRSGTQVFDWKVPKEWNILDAYVKNSEGKKVVNFKRSNLHVVQYSVPVHSKLPLEELKSHLFSISDQPDVIPYRTSYYRESWGFCISYSVLQSLQEGEYEVVIDSTLEEGSLTYGEYFLPGETSEEVLISCHSCHPSLCNDNLSGMALSTYLAKLLTPRKLRYSYRFLFIPGTIGSITWLSLNQERVSKIKHGLVVACVGDPGCSTYKRSRQGNAEVDKAVEHVLKHSGSPYKIRDFSPYGYDERQYCSPGFNLPVGSLTRTPHGEFPQYHTSADNLEFVQPDCLADSLAKYVAVVGVLEENRKYMNLNPMCEPQLGKRGLDRTMGGETAEPVDKLAMLWVLNMSDGNNSLLDIADRSGISFRKILAAARALETSALVEALDARRVDGSSAGTHRDMYKQRTMEGGCR